MSTVEPAAPRVSDTERSRRWRMVLGGVPDDAGAPSQGFTATPLHGVDTRIDAALAAVYDTAPGRRGRSGRAGGLGSSAPGVVRWLGDIRRYFPSTVVQVMQRDAIDRLRLRQLLLEPEMLQAVEPDLHLATLLVELNHLLPDATRASARRVVSQVVAAIQQRLWARTLHANLRHYQPQLGTVVPEKLVGFGRRQRSLARDVVVAIDQSGSMAESVVYAAVFGAVLASIPALSTRVVAFDTSVVDLTPVLHDPVDVLFGVQLGGGTDIGAALAYCRTCITRPSSTVVVLVSDLFEGGNVDRMRSVVAEMVHAGVAVVVLLALSDEGAPMYDHTNAAALAEMGVPSLACTPDAFPDLLAAALEGRDVARWANEHGLHTAVPPT